MAAIIRACADPGLRCFDMDPDSTKYVCALNPDGTWKTWRGVRYFYEPVELVGDTTEDICQLALELRNRAPFFEDGCVHWWPVNAGYYMTIDRKHVLEMAAFIVPRGSTDEQFPFFIKHNTCKPPSYGPLATLDHAIRSTFRRWVEKEDGSLV